MSAVGGLLETSWHKRLKRSLFPAYFGFSPLSLLWLWEIIISLAQYVKSMIECWFIDVPAFHQITSHVWIGSICIIGYDNEFRNWLFMTKWSTCVVSFLNNLHYLFTEQWMSQKHLKSRLSPATQQTSSPTLLGWGIPKHSPILPSEYHRMEKKYHVTKWCW